MQGKGIGLILTTTSGENPDIQVISTKLQGGGGVFTGCTNTMKHTTLDKNNLIEAPRKWASKWIASAERELRVVVRCAFTTGDSQ